jgi:hypothetical protein
MNECDERRRGRSGADVVFGGGGGRQARGFPLYVTDPHDHLSREASRAHHAPATAPSSPAAARR